MFVRFSLWILYASLSGCITTVRPITQRPLQGIRATEERKQAKPDKEQPDLFTRKRDLFIEPTQNDNSNGSLIRPDDEKNYFFTSRIPTQVGEYIQVEIDSVRVKPNKDSKEGNKEKEPDIQEAMLKEFPTLAPPDGEDKQLLGSIKMRITYVHENGDLLVTYSHDSISNEEGHNIQVRARIPYAKVISGSPIKTSDLSQIHFMENLKQELVERNSSEWQDDYSLRISGFTEAGSKQARELQDKRRKLEKDRDTLRKQLITFGKEKQKLAKERDALLAQEQKLAGAQKENTKGAPTAPPPLQGNPKDAPATTAPAAADPAAPVKQP
jgi:hypothetical protein